MPTIEYSNIKREVGFYEIRVFGENNVTYAAPSMIYHYITHHNYLPPEEFIKAVLTFDEQKYKEKFYKNPVYVCDNFWLEKDRTLL
ncbi:MAG: hypothetical protein K2M46_09595 [Lachnospiraceae bacterium]|nr:hypothetical protein [Lachnospiraceae bacterium]